MYTSSDLRKGLKILIDEQPWIITEFDFSKPGKGQAIYNCKLKNMLNGTTMSRSYRSGDRFDKPELETSPSTSPMTKAKRMSSRTRTTRRSAFRPTRSGKAVSS